MLSAIFNGLLVNDCTVLESKYLSAITDNPLKKSLIANIKDEYTLEQFKVLSELRVTEKLTQLESSINRLSNFTSSELLSLCFATQEHALDIDHCIDNNHMVLFNLRQSGTISAEQARLVATLVLHELIGCVRARPPAKRPRDVFIYLDEVHNYITPMLADSFTADRKHGLRYTIAHQVPSQLRDLDPYIYHSTVGGCQSKLIFGNLPWEEIELLEKDYFAGQHDIKKIKHKLYQRKIMDYLEETRIVSSWSDGQTETSSWFSADGQTEADSMAQSRGRGSFSGMSSADVMNPNAGFFTDPTISHTDGINSGTSEQSSDMTGHSQGKSSTSGQGGATGSSHSDGESEVPFLKPVFGSELSSIERETIDEQRYKHCVTLKRMPERTCCLKILSAPPLFVKIKSIRTYQPSEQQLQKFNQLMYNSHNCFAPAEVIRNEIAERTERLLNSGPQITYENPSINFKPKKKYYGK